MKKIWNRFVEFLFELGRAKAAADLTRRGMIKDALSLYKD